jgi:hypothetical protein
LTAQGVFREAIDLLMEVGRRTIDSGRRDEIFWHYRQLARFFRRAMAGDMGALPDLEVACRTYDHLYFALWRSKLEVSELGCFNEDVVLPFAKFIAEQTWPDAPANRCQPSGDSPFRLAYLAQWDQFGGTNGIPRVTWTNILGHQTLRNNQNPPMVYCCCPPGPDIVEAAKRSNVPLKQVGRNGSIVDTAKAVIHQAHEDSLDALVVDTATALATVLFTRRTAPVQAFLEMGFAAWRVPNLDFLFQGISKDWSMAVPSPQKCEQSPRNIHIDFLTPERSQEEIAALRRSITVALRPEQDSVHRASGGTRENPRIIYGFYGRMMKVTATYLQLVERILEATPGSICYIGGAGENPVLAEFLQKSRLSERIVYQPGFVDGHVVGRVIDVFLDTFPFPGGLSCLESQAKGVPVIWHSDSIAGQFHVIKEQRDPELGARDEADFVRLAVGLAEPAKLEAASSRAHSLAREHCNGEKAAARMENILQQLLTPSAECC